MKILLNTNEMYEIKLPEQITIEELSPIVMRFQSLQKTFSKINLNGTTNDSTIIIPENQLKQRETYDFNKWKRLRDDRELFIKILKSYYNDTKEDFEETCNINNVELSRHEMGSSQVIRIRELHRTKPFEVGLTKFPTKQERVETLRIKTK